MLISNHKNIYFSTIKNENFILFASYFTDDEPIQARTVSRSR